VPRATEALRREIAPTAWRCASLQPRGCRGGRPGRLFDGRPEDRDNAGAAEGRAPSSGGPQPWRARVDCDIDSRMTERS